VDLKNLLQRQCDFRPHEVVQWKIKNGIFRHV
jgi:hypothetical protein